MKKLNMMNAEHRKLLEQEMVNFCLKVKMFILKVMFHYQISYLSYNEKIFIIGIVAFYMLVVTHRIKVLTMMKPLLKTRKG